jgi:hypothetical protein
MVRKFVKKIVGFSIFKKKKRKFFPNFCTRIYKNAIFFVRNSQVVVTAPMFQGFALEKIKIRIKGQEFSEGNCEFFNFSKKKVKFSLTSAL